MPRREFLAALTSRNTSGSVVFGSATSLTSVELMEKTGAYFPQAHLDAETMARLAIANHTELGFDVVTPLYSVCHEAAAMGCNVDWGNPLTMPDAGRPIFRTAGDIQVPPDLLTRPACAVPLAAISLLKKRLGDSAAVCGKVFGSWTQSYHYFGVENFLVMTLDDPAAVQRILDKLVPVTVAFANAQLDAGADCVTLADHATRDLCSPQAYRQFLLPLHTRLAEEIRGPVVLHICGNTSDRLGMIAQTGLECFHWDTKTGEPDYVRGLAGQKLSLMGGVSNLLLLRGTPEEVARQAATAAASGIDIVGPECAIPLGTPIANLKAITSLPRKA